MNTLFEQQVAVTSPASLLAKFWVWFPTAETVSKTQSRSWVRAMVNLVGTSLVFATCVVSVLSSISLSRSKMKQIGVIRKYNQEFVEENSRSKITCAGR